MAKKLTNNVLSDQPQTVGLDIGFGFTKAVTATSEIMFPSVAAHARQIDWQSDEIIGKHPGDLLLDDDGDFFIGDLANIHATPAEHIQLRGRTGNEAEVGNVFRLRMAKAALGKLYPGKRNGEVVHIRLATGLPVDHMRQAGALKQALIGTHNVQTDSTHFVANITECMVMPQPYGTIYSRMLKTNGELDPCHTALQTGVVDIGRYTIDIALDDDGEYVETRSGSIEGGVHLALERIKKAVNRDFQEWPSDKTAEEILKTSCINIDGESINYQDVVNEAIQPLLSATSTLLNSKWQAGRFINVIYVSGGGATLAYRTIKTAYKQAVLVESAQSANARGYLNYANFKARG